MKNTEYWKKRFELLEQKQNQIGVQCFSDIEKQFRQAQKQLEGQLSAWYQRFADNNGISMKEARKWLTAAELEEFKWDVNQYIQYGKENAINGQWVKQLENASARYHISRLEALKLQTQQSIETLFGNQLDSIDKTMKNVYRSGYYHTAFEIQKGFGVGWDFAALDDKQIAKVINTPWAVDGKNFSERVWNNRTKLINELNTELTRNIITGANPQKAIDAIARKMNASKKAAGKLVMTEEAFFSSAAQKDCFAELDVEQFEVVATLDSHTSEICRGMDGKHFKMSEWEVGVTAPPFHPWCRSTTVPYFDDNLGSIGERAAKGEDGKTYYVPANMTYKEWEKSFIGGGDKSELKEIKPDDKINITSDISAYKKKDAIDRLKTEYGIDFKDSKKYAMDEKLLSSCVSWLDGFSSRYSSFMQNINHKLPLIQNQPASKMKGKVGCFSWYSFNGKVDSIELNGVYFSNYDTMQKYVQSAIRSKWTVANAEPNKTFVHEFGHYVSHSMKEITGNPKWEHDFIQDCITEFKKQVPDYQYSTYVGMGDYVSRYGATKESELFAEAFAEAYGGENPRIFAQIFGEKLDKLLKGVK